jgi:hypothetical protein
MAQEPHTDKDRQEFFVKELQSLRESRSAALAALSASITKYHFIRVAGFFVIALLVSGRDFSQPEWRRQELALNAWTQQYSRSQYVLAMPYSQLLSSKFPKDKRDKLTHAIELSSVSKRIDPGSDMREVAEFLAANDYGINPLELPELFKQIELIRDQKGAVTLSDLNDYHYEGGPFVQGTRLKDNFFKYVITKHPVLSKEFPYIPTSGISEYLSSLETKIHAVVDRNTEVFSAFTSYYQDYDFYDWNWYAWKTLPDSAVVDWRSNVLDKFSPVMLRKEGPTDLTYVMNYFNSIVKSGRDNELRSREKVNVGPINVDLPIAFILLTFPIFFFGASALFRAMDTQRTLVAVDISKIEYEIAASTSAPPLRYVPEPDTLKRSPYRLIAQGRYRELFSAFPNFFVDSTCRIIAALAGAYVLLRLCTIVVFSDTSLLGKHDALIASGLSGLGVGINLAILWICSHALADTKAR